MNTKKQIYLGLLLVSTVGVLVAFTTFLSDAAFIRSGIERHATFPEARGLREGNAILVAGVRIGRVRELSVDWKAAPQERVRAVLGFEEDIEIREGYSVTIADATLLGGRHVLVDPGAPGGEILATDVVLLGAVQKDPITAATDLIDEIREGQGTFGRLVADVDLAQTVAESLDSAAATLKNLERATALLANGEGTVGALLTDRTVYEDLVSITDNLSETSKDAATLMAALSSGDGLVARVVNDEDLAEDFAGTIADLRRIIADVRAGRGTLGQIVSDDALAKNTNAILEAIVRGDGTIGALLQDAELYDNLSQTMDDFALVSSVIRNGEGSLGRFLMDDEIYLDARRALGLLTASLEELREAAPVTTFTSVLFGAF